MVTRVASTRERMQGVALDLFERDGYAAVTVDQIAAAAGVSHMTFFRHFASKERVLLDDPFDPVLVAALEHQSHELPAIERVARAILSATGQLDDYGDEDLRRRLRVTAKEPSLRSGLDANSRTTMDAVAGTARHAADERELRMAAAACIGALTVALLTWADDDSATLGSAVAAAMHVVCPATAPEGS